MFQPIVKKSELITDLQNLYGSKITTADVKGYCASHGYRYYTITRYLKDFRNGRGKWNLKVTAKKVAQIEKSFEAPAALPATQQSLIPTKDDTFVQFGSFQDVKKIIQSRLFYPTFITGLSGNGKTFSVEQACASLKRELIRVNITIETDEDDLIGGFRLLNGQTVWHNGPIIEALERGSILLLDEIDLASNKILCLQSILEGKGVFLKKIGRYVKPAPGFNVIATANTKGKGSEDGRFIGTNVLNEAFLERFPVTFEQAYPSVKTEFKILQGLAATLNIKMMSSVRDLLIGVTLSVRHSMMVVSKRLSLLVDLFTSFVHMQSSRTKQKQLKFVSIVLMMRPNRHSWSCTTK